MEHFSALQKLCLFVCVRWLQWSRWNSATGENSCRSDCLSLRNKCCTLSFTSSSPPLPLLLSSHLVFPSSHFLFSSCHFFTTCQFTLPSLTLPPFFSVPSSSVLTSPLFSSCCFFYYLHTSSFCPSSHLSYPLFSSLSLHLILFFFYSSPPHPLSLSLLV